MAAQGNALGRGVDRKINSPEVARPRNAMNHESKKRDENRGRRWLVRRILDLPFRALRAILSSVHWFFSVLAVVYIAAFVATLVHPGWPGVKQRTLLPRPWIFGAGAVMFTLAAIASWIGKLRPGGLTSEQIEQLRVQHLAEIANWLSRRITVEDVREMIAAHYAAFGHTEGAPDLIAVFDEWFAQNASPEDELWWYDTGGDSWERLCGADGFALVRNGRVVASMNWSEN